MRAAFCRSSMAHVSNRRAPFAGCIKDNSRGRAGQLMINQEPFSRYSIPTRERTSTAETFRTTPRLATADFERIIDVGERLTVCPTSKSELRLVSTNISDRNTRAIAGLRIAIGVLFLIFGEYKVFGAQFTMGGGFQYWINNFLKDGAYPFIGPLLRRTWRLGAYLPSVL